MEISKKRIELTPLKVVSLSVGGLLFFLAFLSNILQMVAFGGGTYVAGLVFAMFGEFVMAFAVALIIWLLSDVLEGKKLVPQSKKPKITITTGENSEQTKNE